MKDNAKCFIKKADGSYKEITYLELKKKRSEDNTYKLKKFIPVQNMLIEVTSEQYEDFYRDIERGKYLKKKARNYQFISINQLPTQFDVREQNLLTDKNANTEFEAEQKMKIEKLKEALLKLDEDEYKLIKELFFDEKSLRKYAESIGIPFTTIQNRKNRTLEKLRNFIKN